MALAEQEATSLRSLPNEIIAKIFKNCTLESLLKIAMCGKFETWAVHNLSKSDVDVVVNYEKPGKFTMYLTSDENVCHEWVVRACKTGGCTIKLRNKKGYVLYRTSQACNFIQATFNIYNKLLTSKMFTVKTTTLYLGDFAGTIKTVVPIHHAGETLILMNCGANDLKNIRADFATPPKTLFVMPRKQGWTPQETEEMYHIFKKRGIKEMFFPLTPPKFVFNRSYPDSRDENGHVTQKQQRQFVKVLQKWNSPLRGYCFFCQTIGFLRFELRDDRI